MDNRVVMDSEFHDDNVVSDVVGELSSSIKDDRKISEDGLALRIAHLCIPTIQYLGYQLIWVEFVQEEKQILRFVAQKPDYTFSIDDCTKISRSLSALLDVHDPIEQAYDLEISSAGVNRVLVRKDDFNRYNGFEIRVELKQLFQGRKKIRGRLADVTETAIVLSVTDKQNESYTMTIRYDEIRIARVVATQELFDYLMKKPH